MSRNNLSINGMLDGDYNKKTMGEKLIILDDCTPIILEYMKRLSTIEQSIIYHLIFQEGVKKYLTNKKLPKKVTTYFLSKKTREDSKKLSVYLKRLVDRGDIVREPINKKDFEYGIENIQLIDWFKMRHSMSREWDFTTN